MRLSGCLSPDDDTYLAELFERAWLCAAPLILDHEIDELRADFLSRYDEPWRAYHALGHPLGILRAIESRVPSEEFERMGDAESAKLVLMVAYHDVIYRIGADWCEESSARYFEKLARIYRADDAIVADVAKGILASRNHFDRDPLLSETTHLFLDGDLHTFALEDHDAYLAIVSGIREEAFACGATEAVFRAGRISFLEKVLLRTADRFFHSPSFAPFDRLARRNIEAELATLRASVP